VRLSRANKRDRNEPEIVAALEAIGCTVIRLDLPLDLLVYYKKKFWLLEIKAEGGRLTKGQREFIERHPGPVAVVREPEEAIRIVTGASVEMQGVRNPKP
jgi:hypothetical protein